MSFFSFVVLRVFWREEEEEEEKKLTLFLFPCKKKKKKFCSRESYSWRNTLTSESAAWRTFVKEEIHAMGLAL